MGTEVINVFWHLKNAVLCLGFLIGFGTGIFLVIRKQRVAGFLAMVGFLLFGLEPITDFIVYRIIYNQNMATDMYPTFDYVYLCISTPAYFLGSIALVIAMINMMKTRQNLSSNDSENTSLEN